MQLTEERPIRLSPMLGPWQQYDPGSVEWAKAIALHFQSNYWHIQRDGSVAPLVRIIRTALEAETPPWSVWPEEVKGDPKRWVKRITGDDWDTVGTLLRHGDPEAWNEISGAIAQWEAVNRTKGGDTSKVGDTYKASDWDATEAQGIRRRLYKRANSGDGEAAALIRQLGTGEITVNQAAIAAGMRAKYIRVPDDEPDKVAESLVRRKCADWAAQLAAALTERLTAAD